MSQFNREEQQQPLPFRVRGGKRAGAGRPSRRARPGVPHGPRAKVRAGEPVHVSVGMAEWVWNLRSERSFAIVHAALEAARRRPDCHVVHFSVLGNHLHLIVEAVGAAALSNGMRALGIRLARGLNRMMGRRGPVLADRYHAHVLRTPAEVRNAVRYVVGNFARHAARRGERLPEGWVDPWSSAACKLPRAAQGSLFAFPVTREPRSWLLRWAEREAGGRAAGVSRGA